MGRGGLGFLSVSGDIGIYEWLFCMLKMSQLIDAEYLT